MRIKTITYSKTWQLKQYEPERIEVVAEVGEGERAEDVMDEMKAFVFANSTAQKQRKTRKSIRKQIEELEELEDTIGDDFYDDED
jgi:hypothetical protein